MRFLSTSNFPSADSTSFKLVNIFSRFSSVTQSCLTICHPMDCITPGFPVHHQHLELAQTHVCRVCDAIQLFHPLLPLPSIFHSIRVFSNESVLHIMWPKYWSFSFSISPSSECSVLVSFRIDWFDLAVQGMLKSLLQHHSLKASTWVSCIAGRFFSVWATREALTSQLSLVYSQRCATIITINFRTFSSPPKETLHPVAITFWLSQPYGTTFLLSIPMDLF